MGASPLPAGFGATILVGTASRHHDSSCWASQPPTSALIGGGGHHDPVKPSGSDSFPPLLVPACLSLPPCLTCLAD